MFLFFISISKSTFFKANKTTLFLEHHEKLKIRGHIKVKIFTIILILKKMKGKLIFLDNNVNELIKK